MNNQEQDKEKKSNFRVSSVIYNINNLDSIISDANRRTESLKQFQILLDQKLKLQQLYHKGLKQIVNSISPLNTSNLSGKIPSQFITLQLINQFKQELITKDVYINSLEKDIIEPLKILNINREVKIRPQLVLAKKLSMGMKDLASQLKQSKAVYQNQLISNQSLKNQYISSFFAEQFQKGNDKRSLNSKIVNLQNSISSLKKQYELSLQKYAKAVANYYKKAIKLTDELVIFQKDVLKTIKSYLLQYQNIQCSQAKNLYQFLKRSTKNTVQIHQQDEIKFQKQENVFEIQENLFKLSVQQNIFFNKLFENIVSNNIIQLDEYLEKYQEQDQFYKQFLNLQNKITNAALGNKKQENLNQKIQMSLSSQVIFNFLSAIYSPNLQKQKTKYFINYLQKLFNVSFQRKDFIRCLQIYQRSQNSELKQEGVNTFISILKLFVNKCSENLDTYNLGKLIQLQLSYTINIHHQEQSQLSNQIIQKNMMQQQKNAHQRSFKTESNKGVQTFSFIDKIKQHQIFKNMDWWQCVLIQRIYLEYNKLLKSNKKQKKPSLVNILGLGSSQSKNVCQSPTGKKNSIVLLKLTELVHIMPFFGVEFQKLNQFGEKNIDQFKMTQKQRKQVQKQLPLNLQISKIDDFSEGVSQNSYLNTSALFY